jgi:superoxide reductase
MICCGEEMTELAPNAKEASVEKHLPAVTVSGEGINVRIGSAPHPMEEAHSSEFV